MNNGVVEKIIRWLIVVAVAVSGTAQAQVAATNLLGFKWAPVVRNDSSTNPAANVKVANDDTNLVPLIQFTDVPITVAIESLARQMDINYLIDPHVTQEWQIYSVGVSHEPVLNLKWQSITPRMALENILSDYDLKLVENPVTSVSEILPVGQNLEPVDASLLDMTTNVPITGHAIVYSNGVIPLVQLMDVPVNSAFGSFFRQAGLAYILHPKITDQNYPSLSVTWKNITPKQAILAICEQYNLVLSSGDSAANVDCIVVQPRPVKRHHHLLLR